MPKTAARALLTDFLKTRRARLHPEVLGITSEGDLRRRRSAGLRRSEVARLAGISTEWYTLFEMGQERAMTVRIIEPIARALQLNEDERDYVYDLVRAEPPPQESTEIPPSLMTALSLSGDIIMIVYDRWQTPIAWNLLTEALLGIHADDELHTNALWRLFFQPELRRVYVQWHERAVAALGLFRRTLGRDPANPNAMRILGAMMTDENFRRMWAMHDVRSVDSETRLNGRTTFHIAHPRYGIFGYRCLNMVLPASAGGFIWIASPSDDAAQRAWATATADYIAEHGGRRVYGRKGLFDPVKL